MALTVSWLTVGYALLGLSPGWALAAALASLPAITGSVAAGTVLVINGLGHTVGYRSHDTRDTSHNIVAFDWLGMGEALHNNHHAFPGSARLARAPGELDLGWLSLRALKRVGLVTALKG
jgi:fatty-acid desaturase